MKKILSLFISLLFLFSLVACDINGEELPADFYFGETMEYDDIEVTVDSLSESSYSIPSTNENGYTIRVTFTLKNNKTKEFSVDDDCFDIRTEDRNEKYTPEQILFYRSIIAGGQGTFCLEFKVPYSMLEKNYVMYFDWGLLHTEQKYCLYNRDGSNAITNGDNAGEDTSPDGNENDYSSLFAGICPVEIHVTYYTLGQTLTIKQTNQGGKTIAAIKYLIVVYNIYGEILQQYGYGASALTATYDNLNINPGGNCTGDWELRGFSDGKSLDIYIYSVYYTDNTEWGSHNLSVTDIKNYAPKIHVTGGL